MIRAYAALTIKRKGIREAREALARLSKGRIRSGVDRCQFHLLYGLFYLGIGDPHRASEEFAKAHRADKLNVYVMMKWARTLYELGISRWLEADESWKDHLNDCAALVRKILEFDRDNEEGVRLLQQLVQRFDITV